MMFQDMGMFNMNNDVNNELIVFQSTKLMKRCQQNFNLFRQLCNKIWIEKSLIFIQILHFKFILLMLTTSSALSNLPKLRNSPTVDELYNFTRGILTHYTLASAQANWGPRPRYRQFSPPLEAIYSQSRQINLEDGKHRRNTHYCLQGRIR